MTVPVTGIQAVPTTIAAVGECKCIGFAPSFDVAPDGSAYVVSTLAMPNPWPPRDGIYVVDATTLEPRRLGDTPGGTVSWRPAP